MVFINLLVVKSSYSPTHLICFYAACGQNGFSSLVSWPLVRCKQCRWPATQNQNVVFAFDLLLSLFN
jgi:hypothetical protein